jgi:hypothetical protein
VRSTFRQDKNTATAAGVDGGGFDVEGAARLSGVQPIQIISRLAAIRSINQAGRTINVTLFQ